MPTNQVPVAAQWLVDREFAPCRHSSGWLREAYRLLLGSSSRDFDEQSGPADEFAVVGEPIECLLFEEGQGCPNVIIE